eukprot:3860143-Rhodomonas_salina.1
MEVIRARLDADDKEEEAQKQPLQLVLVSLVVQALGGGQVGPVQGAYEGLCAHLLTRSMLFKRLSAPARHRQPVRVRVRVRVRDRARDLKTETETETETETTVSVGDRVKRKQRRTKRKGHRLMGGCDDVVDAVQAHLCSRQVGRWTVGGWNGEREGEGRER